MPPILYMALWWIINKPRPLGMYLCLDWCDSEIWVSVLDCLDLIENLIPKSEQKPQYVLRMFLECRLITATCAVGGEAVHLLQSGWRALTDLLENGNDNITKWYWNFVKFEDIILCYIITFILCMCFKVFNWTLNANQVLIIKKSFNHYWRQFFCL